MPRLYMEWPGRQRGTAALPTRRIPMYNAGNKIWIFFYLIHLSVMGDFHASQRNGVFQGARRLHRRVEGKAGQPHHDASPHPGGVRLHPSRGRREARPRDPHAPGQGLRSHHLLPLLQDDEARQAPHRDLPRHRLLPSRRPGAPRRERVHPERQGRGSHR